MFKTRAASGMERRAPLSQDPQGTWRSEWQSLSQEKSPDLYLNGLLQFGERLAAQGQMSLALEVYERLQTEARGLPEYADYARRAEEKTKALSGGGSFASRADLALREVSQNAGDLRSLLPMLAGSTVYSLARGFALGRLAATARPLRFAANLFAFSAEVGAFHLTRRALGPEAHGDWSQELLGDATTLAAMKAFGWGARRSLALTPQGTRTGAALREYLPHAASFLGLAAAEHLNGHGQISFGELLVKWTGMTAGSHLAGCLLGPGWRRFQGEIDLRADAGPTPPGGFRLLASGEGAPTRDLALTTGSRAIGRPILPSEARLFSGLSQMAGIGSSGGLGSLETWRTLRRQCVELVREKFKDPKEKRELLAELAEIHQWLQEAEKHSDADLLAKAAERLRSFEEEWLTGPAPKKSPSPLPAPAHDPRGPSFEAQALLKKNLEVVLKNAETLQSYRKMLVVAYEARESRLHPLAQEKYLQAMSRVRMIAESHAHKAKSLMSSLHRVDNAEIIQVTGEQRDLQQEMQGLLENLVAEKLLDPSELTTEAKWKLREYQGRMLQGVKNALVSGEHPWIGIASPMQTGKSYLAGPLIEILREHFGPKTRFLILSSARVITGQVIDDLSTGFPVSRIGRFDGLVKDPKEITVASIYALARNLEDFRRGSDPVVIINDEAYSTQTSTVGKIYSHFGFATRQNDEQKRVVYAPRQGHGVVIGLSGTGAGLKDYTLSGELTLFDAIKEGWIRHMEGERVMLTLLSKDVGGVGAEKMIWWDATELNAGLLTKIYEDKIHSRFADCLVFVPTIEHGELLQEAMAERYGADYARLVHSGMEEEDVDRVMAEWEIKKGPLISVKKLSRGFRGTGTASVFHTYQTDSMELFAQRTGRAWGKPEGSDLPNLYVLEATWKADASFANLARLLGLAEYSRERLFTEELDFDRIQEENRIAYQKRKSDPAEAVERSNPLFADLPILETWRTAFGKLFQEAGGSVADLAERTGLPQEILAGYALGALPIRRIHIWRLEGLLGGKRKATELWVDSWKQAFQEIKSGETHPLGMFGNDWGIWVETEGQLWAKSKRLDQLLRKAFPEKRARGFESFVGYARNLAGLFLGERELADLVEAAVTSQTKDVKDWRKDFVRDRVLHSQPKSIEWWEQELKQRDAYHSLSLLTIESRWIKSLEREIEERLYEALKRKLKSAESPRIESLSLAQDAAAGLEAAQLRTLGDILELTALDLLALPGISVETLEELGEHLPPLLARHFPAPLGAGSDIELQKFLSAPKFLRDLDAAKILTLGELLASRHRIGTSLGRGTASAEKVLQTLRALTDLNGGKGGLPEFLWEELTAKAGLVSLEKMGLPADLLAAALGAGIRSLADWRALSLAELHLRTGYDLAELRAVTRRKYLEPEKNKNHLLPIQSLVMPESWKRFLADHRMTTLRDLFGRSGWDLLRLPDMDFNSLCEMRDEVHKATYGIIFPKPWAWNRPDADYKISLQKLNLPDSLEERLRQSEVETVDRLLTLRTWRLAALPGMTLQDILALKARIAYFNPQLFPWDHYENWQNLSVAVLGLGKKNTALLEQRGIVHLGDLPSAKRKAMWEALNGMFEPTEDYWDFKSRSKWRASDLEVHIFDLVWGPDGPLRGERPIDDLGLPAEIVVVLREARVNTVGDLKQMEASTVLALPGIDYETLQLIQRAANQKVSALKIFPPDFRVNILWKKISLHKFKFSPEELRKMEAAGFATVGDLVERGDNTLFSASGFDWPLVRRLRSVLPLELHDSFSRQGIEHWHFVPLRKVGCGEDALCEALEPKGIRTLGEYRFEAWSLLKSGFPLGDLARLDRKIQNALGLKKGLARHQSFVSSGELEKIPLAFLSLKPVQIKKLTAEGIRNAADLLRLTKAQWISRQFGSGDRWDEIQADLFRLAIVWEQEDKK